MALWMCLIKLLIAQAVVLVLRLMSGASAAECGAGRYWGSFSSADLADHLRVASMAATSAPPLTEVDVVAGPNFATMIRKSSISQRRLTLAAILVVLCFLGLLGRFFYLQVVPVSALRHTGRGKPHRRTNQKPQPRHHPTDRNGVVLASNYSVYTLELNLRKIADL